MPTERRRLCTRALDTYLAIGRDRCADPVRDQSRRPVIRPWAGRAACHGGAELLGAHLAVRRAGLYRHRRGGGFVVLATATDVSISHCSRCAGRHGRPLPIASTTASAAPRPIAIPLPHPPSSQAVSARDRAGDDRLPARRHRHRHRLTTARRRRHRGCRPGHPGFSPSSS